MVAGTSNDLPSARDVWEPVRFVASFEEEAQLTESVMDGVLHVIEVLESLAKVPEWKFRASERGPQRSGVNEEQLRLLDGLRAMMTVLEGRTFDRIAALLVSTSPHLARRLKSARQGTMKVGKELIALICFMNEIDDDETEAALRLPLHDEVEPGPSVEGCWKD